MMTVRKSSKMNKLKEARGVRKNDVHENNVLTSNYTRKPKAGFNGNERSSIADVQKGGIYVND